MSSQKVVTSLLEMNILKVSLAKKTYPTGDPKFSVYQAFPGSLSSKESDPFLMCDHFGPTVSPGPSKDPDDFAVPWHPHRGMDIVTYLTSGVAKHADSMGNREEFHAPGMQWISVGSGIEHAEGFNTPKGEPTEGFQIWINVPSALKMDDPRYGTEPPDAIPLLEYGQSPRVSARLLAGPLDGAQGPFKTVQPVQMVDFALEAKGVHRHEVPQGLDNAMVYVRKGAGRVNGQEVGLHHVLRLDASQEERRGVLLEAGEEEALQVIVFSGKRLNQPIAWHGPFVMTTQAEIAETVLEYRRGTFLRQQAPWDYKDWNARQQ